MTNKFIEIITNGLNPDRTVRRRQIIDAINELSGRDTFRTIRKTLREAKWSYQNALRYAKLLTWLQIPRHQDIKDSFEFEILTINEALARLKNRGLSMEIYPTEDWNHFYYRNEKGEVKSYEQSA